MEARLQPRPTNPREIVTRPTQHPSPSLSLSLSVPFHPLSPSFPSLSSLPLAATSNARFLFRPQGWRPGCHEQRKTNACDGGGGREREREGWGLFSSLWGSPGISRPVLLLLRGRESARFECSSKLVELDSIFCLNISKFSLPFFLSNIESRM